MRREIADLHRRLGNTMVYVTHDQVEAMTMADRIAVLRAGQLEQYGPPLELYNRPANRFVAGFIGLPKMNFLAATAAEEGRVALASGGTVLPPAERFTMAPGAAMALGIRANHLSIVSADNADLIIDVTSTEQLGGETHIYGHLEDGTAVTLHRSGQVDVRRGTRIGARLDPDAIHLFDAGAGSSLRAES